MVATMVTLSEETCKRIGRIEETCAAIDRLSDLMMPLVKHLIPFAEQMDIDAISDKGRTVALDRSRWKKQYEKGVNRCMGFDILWN